MSVCQCSEDLASPKCSSNSNIYCHVGTFALKVNKELMFYGDCLVGAGYFSRYSRSGGGWGCGPSLEADSELPNGCL